MSSLLLNLVALLAIFVPQAHSIQVEPDQVVAVVDFAPSYDGAMCWARSGVCAPYSEGTILIRPWLLADPELATWVLAHEQGHYWNWKAGMVDTAAPSTAEEEARADAYACSIIRIDRLCEGH